VEAVDLAQILLSVTTMIGDPGIDDGVAHGRQERHQRPEAVAKYGNVPGALGHLHHSFSGVPDILGAGVSVVGLIEAKAVLPVCL